METNDHDMLIKLDTKMSLMCSKLNKIGDKNDSAHDSIYKLLDKKIDITNDKLDKKTDDLMFRWVIGFIIGFIIIITGAGVNHISADNNQIIEKPVYHSITKSIPQNENINTTPQL